MKELDPLLHSQLRLAVMSILLNVEEADFNYIKEKTESTAGNISVQLDKLVTAGYISKTTDGSGVKPRTICKMTDTGRNAMMKYVEALKTYSLIFSEDFGAKAYDISITQSCPFNNSKYCQKSSCGDSFFSQPTLYTSERERSRDTTRSNRTLCSPNVAMSQHTVTRSSSPL